MDIFLWSTMGAIVLAVAGHSMSMPKEDPTYGTAMDAIEYALALGEAGIGMEFLRDWHSGSDIGGYETLDGKTFADHRAANRPSRGKGPRKA